ncbi:MAG: hypothetical protein AcusKO_19860 [Acuticoccus sp.]
MRRCPGRLAGAARPACGAALLALLTLFAADVHAQVPDLAGLKASITTEEATANALQRAITQQRTINADLARQLESAEAIVATPTMTDLRQAQFEVDMARTRILNLTNNRTGKQAEISALNALIVQQTTNTRSTENPTLSTVVDEATLALRQQLKTASEAVADAFGTLEATQADALSWRREQLLILQNAASFDALISDARARDSAAVRRIRALVQTLGQRALSLSNLASDLGEANSGATEERNALRVQADELTLRANARLTDIAIVETRAILEGIKPLVSEKAVPVRLLDEAQEALDTQEAALKDRAEVSVTIGAALNDFSQILRDWSGASSEDLLASVERLRRLLRQQGSETTSLFQSIAESRTALSRERARREREQLFSRESGRTDEQSRKRIAVEVMEMPHELRALYETRLAEIRAAMDVAGPRQIAMAGGLFLVLVVLTLVFRQRVLKRFINASVTKATEVPLEVLRRNVFWLFPLAAWAIFAMSFQISETTMQSVFVLLCIPAAAASLFDFTKVIVNRSGAATRLGTLINRLTGVAMVLTAIVLFIYVLLDELPMLPSTQAALNRLAYSVFVLAGLPMLLFAIVFAKPPSGRTTNALRSVVASFLSLLPPAALIATGLAGLLGYTELASIMLEDLAIAIAILGVLALLLGVLYDVTEGIASQIRERDPARAYFVRQNFISPLKSICQAILAVLAFIAAAQFFNWTSDTYGVAEVLSVWNHSLFTVGSTSYSVGHVVIALAAFGFVFWFAAWSRRIAYSVVLRQVKDIGIRQSLSVFAQYVVIVFGVLLTLTAVGFDVTTLTVFAASLGVGIGFGLQNVVNNFISGILLLVERPLRLGDIVTVGTASGTVSQIGIRSMRLRTFDEFDLIVPNSALISDTFTNWTRSNSLMRVVLPVGISYDDDPTKAVAIVEEVLQEHPGVSNNPAPMVTVEAFGASSVDLRVCYYIDLRGSYSGFVTKSEVLTAIRARFSEAGLSIPFPQRDIHIIAPKAVDASAQAAAPEVRPAMGEARTSDRRAMQGDAIEMLDDTDDD